MRVLIPAAAVLLSACSTPADERQGAPASPALAAASECAAIPEAADPALKAEIDAIVDAAAAEGFAGQVALLRDGAFVYRRAAGSADLAGATPVVETTLFQVASLTKYMTAALTLKAAEEGRIDLASSIAPLAGNTALARRGVTFADLLAHRSGLGSSYAAESHADREAALAAIDAAGMDAASAGSFRYSNDGYDLLAIFLEQIYADTYESLARAKLFAPACLSHVGFWGETDLDDPRIVGQPLRRPPEELRRRNYGMLGSAGLLISASELVAWQRALTGGRVLSKSSLEALFAPRGEMRLGQATYGAFLIERKGLGRVLSARGAEDWGDNAYLNDYLDCAVTLAVVTSRGPAEDQGRPLFRDTIAQAIEKILAQRCAA